MKTLLSVSNIATAALALGAALPLAGCDLWFGNNQCDAVLEPAPGVGLLDPFTGQCQSFGGGGNGGTCGDFGGPVAGDQAEPAMIDMAECFSACTGLAEDECMATPGCRAGYVGDCAEGFDCNNTDYRYYECWATAPSGPAQGDCSSLSAYDCSRHDDCVALHYPGAPCESGGNCAPSPDDPGTIGTFEACAPEPEVVEDGCYGDQDCAEGFSCNAAEVCEPPPGCEDPSLPCPAVCYGQCVPDAPAPSCFGNVTCESLPPACPAGTVPGIDGDCWSGTCIEYAACDPAIDPGTCDGEVFCDSLPPECPAGSVPGITDGCWSGLCIPTEDCANAP